MWLNLKWDIQQAHVGVMVRCPQTFGYVVLAMLLKYAEFEVYYNVLKIIILICFVSDHIIFNISIFSALVFYNSNIWLKRILFAFKNHVKLCLSQTVIATGISYAVDLKSHYGANIVDNIPRG